MVALVTSSDAPMRALVRMDSILTNECGVGPTHDPWRAIDERTRRSSTDEPENAAVEPDADRVMNTTPSASTRPAATLSAAIPDSPFTARAEHGPQRCLACRLWTLTAGSE